MENSGKQNPKMGFKSPEQRRKFVAPQIATVFHRFWTRNLTFLWHMGRNALRRSAGKLLPVDIYERVDQRYHVVWKDETGKRHFASRVLRGSRWWCKNARLLLLQ